MTEFVTTQPKMDLLKARCGAMVFLHFFVAGFHGFTHMITPVPLANWQMIYVGAIIVSAPLYGLWKIHQGDEKQGGMIVGFSLLASFLFGVFFHFIADTPDYICNVPDNMWRPSFIISALGTAFAEFAGAVLGFKIMQRANDL